MTEQNDYDENLLSVMEERENLEEKYGSLKEAPVGVIIHFENYRAALEAKHTRAELRGLLAANLDSSLFYMNDDYDVIREYEEWDFGDTNEYEYFSERELAQLAVLSEEAKRAGFKCKHRCNMLEGVNDIYSEDYRRKYTVIAKEYIASFKRALL